MAQFLEGQLTSSAKEYASDNPVMLRFDLTNTSDQDMYVLKWYTPLEGINSDCLQVTRDGQVDIPYDGPLAKRGKPGPDKYLLVPAKQTVSVEVDISESYRVSVPGEYKVALKTTVHEAIPRAGFNNVVAALAKQTKESTSQELRGSAIRFRVVAGREPRWTRGEVARLASQAELQPPLPLATVATLKAPILSGGTSAQQKEVKKAHEDGFALCEAALAGLANDDQYKEWFGAHTSARFNQVKFAYTAIRDRMNEKVFTYDLTGTGCQSDWFAYTHKGDTKIWLCKLFWEAPANGTDSKGGTILHEHSHSDANTDDLATGQTDARKLARDTPDSAVKNADNYEYYVGG